MRLIVIGGGASGMAAASKAKRLKKDLEVIVVEKENFVSYAECGIPYYLGGYFEDYKKLLHYPIEEFTQKRGIKIMQNTSVNSVLPWENALLLGDGTKLDFDYLVIATGASAIGHQFGNIEQVFTLRTLESAIKAKEQMKGNNVCVVGDGVLGMEIASEMINSGKEVTIISKHTRLFTKMDEEITADMIKEFEKRVHVILNEQVKMIQKKGDKVILSLNMGDLQFDSVIYAIGIKPNTEFLKESGIEIDDRGLIKTDRNMRTNIKNIYAVGDCATSYNRITGKRDWHPLAQVANKMGRVAGSCIGGSEMTFRGALNTTLVKIMNYELGFTGLSEKEASLNGFKVKSINVTAKSRAEYYPGGEKIHLKILYDEETMKLLGAQICGKDGAAWRLNTLETAIYAGMTTEELFYNDLGYTPPFGPVWDPIIIGASLSMRD
ncbi:FAD-dependent oxidoreductase [Cuniculiplasma sp. SKW4]|uniref:FAD-dependent oxidoreductase n=1 Tax=Cuniculiplasma sp. SKW4 TaxID=3400171 RepID=UPI003FD31049